MCQKRKQIFGSGRVLIASLVSQWRAGRELGVYMHWWRAKSNFTDNFLTYRIYSSWHQDISETGKPDTDFVVSYQQHSSRCPCRSTPYLFARYAWRTRYNRRMYTRHSAFQMKCLRTPCTALRAFVRLVLVSSARSFRVPCLCLLKSVTVKQKSHQTVRWVFLRRQVSKFWTCSQIQIVSASMLGDHRQEAISGLAERTTFSGLRAVWRALNPWKWKRIKSTLFPRRNLNTETKHAHSTRSGKIKTGLHFWSENIATPQYHIVANGILIKSKTL